MQERVRKVPGADEKCLQHQQAVQHVTGRSRQNDKMRTIEQALN